MKPDDSLFHLEPEFLSRKHSSDRNATDANAQAKLVACNESEYKIGVAKNKFSAKTDTDSRNIVTLVSNPNLRGLMQQATATFPQSVFDTLGLCMVGICLLTNQLSMIRFTLGTVAILMVVMMTPPFGFSDFENLS